MGNLEEWLVIGLIIGPLALTAIVAILRGYAVAIWRIPKDKKGEGE
jgi:hypothetical protein